VDRHGSTPFVGSRWVDGPWILRPSGAGVVTPSGRSVALDGLPANGLVAIMGAAPLSVELARGRRRVTGAGVASELAVVPAKIGPPRHREAACPRPRLEEIWDVTSARCLVVVAPAGYGKTTLVRQWADRRPGATAWITSDRGDLDPVCFLRAVVAAFDPIVPMPTARDLLIERVASAGEVVAAICGSLADAPPGFTLVIDDVHELDADPTIEVVERLIDAVPDGSRVVLAGRWLPGLRLGRRELAEEVLTVDGRALAFDRHETSTVVRSAMGGSLTDDAVEELHVRTEGWPAGVQLTMLAVQGQDDPERALHDLLTSDRHVVDYIERELLAGVAPEDRHFLLQTSVLERLSGPLCDAVTATSGAAACLDRLVRSGNLFVVALEQGGAFRYHHLFGELLLAELRRTDPASEPELRRRAARWLLADGDGDGAFHQAMWSGDLDFAADVLYSLLFVTLDRGSSLALERWLDAFDPKEVRRRGPLLVVRAWIALNRGAGDEVAEVLELLDEIEDDRPLPDGTVSLEVARAVLAVITRRGGVKAMAESAEVVIEAGPSGSPWWGVAHMQRAVALHLAGAPDPRSLFDAAERATVGDGAVHAITLAHCALVRLQADDPGGYPLVDQAVAELSASGSEHLPLVVMVFTVLAYAEAKRDRREASAEAARRADAMIQQVGAAIPGGVVHHRLILADAALLRLDPPAAARELALAQEVLPSEPDAVRLHEWADRIARRTSARRRADGESAWSQLSAAELRVLAQLPTHRSLEEIGAHLYISRNTVKSHTIAIYRKLGVSGRSAAVVRATELGLLPG
jgi:LuxR family maltose regulon positive regulatory protein